MNYHTWFQDTPGERHFFNRPSNWKLGYQWYHDQMPLTFHWGKVLRTCLFSWSRILLS